jgi:hypothetical protein
VKRTSITFVCGALLVGAAWGSPLQSMFGLPPPYISNAQAEPGVTMKYEILATDTVQENGSTLFRIKRLSDGLLGGYVQSEKNLSQLGESFAYDGSRISGNAVIIDDAKVFGRATGNARISGRAKLFGQATGNAQISDDAVVRGTVSGEAVIRGHARVFGRVTGHSVVGGDEVVFGNISH